MDPEAKRKKLELRSEILRTLALSTARMKLGVPSSALDAVLAGDALFEFDRANPTIAQEAGAAQSRGHRVHQAFIQLAAIAHSAKVVFFGE